MRAIAGVLNNLRSFRVNKLSDVRLLVFVPWPWWYWWISCGNICLVKWQQDCIPWCIQFVDPRKETNNWPMLIRASWWNADSVWFVLNWVDWWENIRNSGKFADLSGLLLPNFRRTIFETQLSRIFFQRKPHSQKALIWPLLVKHGANFAGPGQTLRQMQKPPKHAIWAWTKLPFRFGAVEQTFLFEVHWYWQSKHKRNCSADTFNKFVMIQLSGRHHTQPLGAVKWQDTRVYMEWIWAVGKLLPTHKFYMGHKTTMRHPHKNFFVVCCWKYDIILTSSATRMRRCLELTVTNDQKGQKSKCRGDNFILTWWENHKSTDCPAGMALNNTHFWPDGVVCQTKYVVNLNLWAFQFLAMPTLVFSCFLACCVASFLAVLFPSDTDSDGVQRILMTHFHAFLILRRPQMWICQTSRMLVRRTHNHIFDTNMWTAKSSLWEI